MFIYIQLLYTLVVLSALRLVVSRYIQVLYYVGRRGGITLNHKREMNFILLQNSCYCGPIAHNNILRMRKHRIRIFDFLFG